VNSEVPTFIFSWSSLNYRVGQKVTKLAYFQTPPANFLLSRPNAAEYCNYEKNLLSTDGCTTMCVTFRKLRRTTPEIHAALFLKTNRLGHVLFPFARWQHCWYAQTALCIRRTLCRHVTIGTPMVLSVFDDWYSVPFVENSQQTVKQQKMTIGVPIVTCLHRVRRIHKPRKLRYIAIPPLHVPGQWPQPVARGQG